MSLTILTDPFAMRVWLAELYPYDPGTAAIVPLTYSSHRDFPRETPYSPRIVSTPSVRRSMFSPERIGGASIPDFGSLVLANNYDGVTPNLDALRTYVFDGYRIVIKVGGVLSDGTVLAYDDYVTIFDGTAAGDALVGETAVTIRLQSNEFKLEVPVQATLYRGMSHCLSFDGVNDDVTVSFTCPAGALTIEMWVNPASSGSTQKILAGWRNGVGAGNRLPQFTNTGANIPSFAVRNDGTTLYQITASSSLPAGVDAHLAFVLDPTAGFLRLYVNGDSAASPVAVAGTWATTLATFVVGKTPDAATAYFDGLIDEVRVWSSARTQAEIKANMNRELVGTETGLQLYWRFNSTSGTTATDTTANARHGTVTGATWASSHEGFADLAGKPKPLLYGEVLELEPVLIDPFRLIYQWHDGASQALVAVYDKGVALTAGAGYTADLTHSRFTLTASPAGRVTCWARGDNAGGYVQTSADIMRRVAVQRGGLADPAGLDTASFTALNTATSATVGIYIAEETSVLDALNTLAAGVGGFHGFTRANLYQVGRFDVPSGTPAASYTEVEIQPDMEPVALERPVWRVIVRHGHNYARQEPENVATIIVTNSTRYSFITNEWREAVAEDPDIQAAYPLARTLTVDSTLLSRADALTEADRLLTLYKVRRDLYRVPLKVSWLGQDLNDVVTLTRPRFGLDAGRDFRIVGFDDREVFGEIVAEVWA